MAFPLSLFPSLSLKTSVSKALINTADPAAAIDREELQGLTADSARKD